MRITQRAIAETSLLGLNKNLSAIGKLQEQLTSGRQLNAPSDSPTGVNRAMQVRQDQSATAQQARNISDGRSWLDAADSTVETMLQQARRVRDLTVQGLNGGSMSESSRTAIATEVESLRSSLLGLANQTVNGRPLFGGPTPGAKAYDDAGVFVGVGGSYVDANGDEQPLTVPQNRRVSDREVLRVDITGPEVLGDPLKGKDLLAVVADIATHVTGEPDALTADLQALDGAIGRLLTAAADIGARAARLESVEQINSDRQLSLKVQLSEVEEIDLPKTIMELNLQETGYQAALSATAKVIQPSLVDFLR